MSRNTSDVFLCVWNTKGIMGWGQDLQWVMTWILVHTKLLDGFRRLMVTAFTVYYVLVTIYETSKSTENEQTEIETAGWDTWTPNDAVPILSLWNRKWDLQDLHVLFSTHNSYMCVSKFKSLSKIEKSPFSSGIIPDSKKLGERTSPARTTQHSGGHCWQQMRSLRCQVNSSATKHSTSRLLRSDRRDPPAVTVNSIQRREKASIFAVSSSWKQAAYTALSCARLVEKKPRSAIYLSS